MYSVTNIDNVVKYFASDLEFVNFARRIYRENEEDQPYPSEIHWLPENVQQATEYIHEYCDNLTLNENDMNKQALITSLALRTGKHVDVLNRYKESALVEMFNNIEPLQLNYEQVSVLLRSLRNTGGASYRPADETLNPSTGYMCALVGFEKQVPRVWNSFDLQQVLNEWLSEISYTGDSFAFIGLWENDGTLYLDLSQHFTNRDKAVAMGQSRNQLAIWDCANKCEIKTR